MNGNHQAILQDLKAEMDEIFGEPAIWVLADGTQIAVIGIFSKTDLDIHAESKHKKPPQIALDHSAITYSMAPDQVPGVEGEQLIIAGVTYVVLPFKRGEYQTSIPLKLSPSENQKSWSDYAALEP